MTANANARAALEQRLMTLVQREAGLQSHLRGEDGRNEADFSDRVAFTEMDEVLEQLDDSARAEITAIRAALQRIEDGSYGVCTSCGEDIAPRRLEVLPTASRCVGCAT